MEAVFWTTYRVSLYYYPQFQDEGTEAEKLNNLESEHEPGCEHRSISFKVISQSPSFVDASTVPLFHLKISYQLISFPLL